MKKEEQKETKAKATYTFPSCGKAVEAESYEEALTKINKK